MIIGVSFRYSFYFFDHKTNDFNHMDLENVLYISISFRHITVAGKGKISEPSTVGTSNLDWRCFEYY
jgi:hypothetical protein